MNQSIITSDVKLALMMGDTRRAARLLGHPYTLEGVVVHGHQLGRRLGYPTANLSLTDPEAVIPKNGVYAALATLQDGSWYKAMVNIGYRPTVDNDHRLTIEAHLIGFDGDIYDQTLSLSFTDRIRDERKMESLDDLKAQLAKDLEETKRTRL